MVVLDSTIGGGGGGSELHMIEHFFAILGAGSAMTTVAFLVFAWRAAEAPYND